MALFAVATVGGLTDLGTICLHIASLWPHPPVVVEADPDGGRLAVRHDWELRPGLGDLIALMHSDRESSSFRNSRNVQSTTDRTNNGYTNNADLNNGLGDVVDSVSHRLRNGVRIVVSPPAIEAVSASMPGLARAVTSLEKNSVADIIVDVGIVRPESPARNVITAASRRIIVVRKEADDVVALAHRRPLLESMGDWFVLTAGGRMRTEDVTRAVEWPVVADLLPHDRKSSMKLRASLARLSAVRSRGRVQQTV
jgi:hypothetical protein